MSKYSERLAEIYENLGKIEKFTDKNIKKDFRIRFENRNIGERRK